jgi:hypothetical protein
LLFFKKKLSKLCLAPKERKAKEAITGGRRNYCYLLLLLLLVPIGSIKIYRNRGKDHGIELISFDLLLLGSFFSAGLFVPPLTCFFVEVRVYIYFRRSCKDGED